VALRVEEQVIRLDVAMDAVERVHVLEASQRLAANVRNLCLHERNSIELLQDVGEAAAVHQLHHCNSSREHQRDDRILTKDKNAPTHSLLFTKNLEIDE